MTGNVSFREVDLMSELHVYPVRPEVAAAAHCDSKKYQEMYEKSVEDPEGFWEAQGRRLDWIRPYSKVKDVSFARNDVHIRWFYDGEEYWFIGPEGVGDREWVFDAQFFMILNLALGGNLPGPIGLSTEFPLYTYVDYVRVYQRTDAAG